MNLGGFKVAINGAPTFPKNGKEQGPPYKGVPCLVSSITLAINSYSKRKKYLRTSTQSKNYNEHNFIKDSLRCNQENSLF